MTWSEISDREVARRSRLAVGCFVSESVVVGVADLDM